MAKSKKNKKNNDSLNRDMSFLLQEKGRWIRLNELFDLQKKNKTITLRISEELLDEIKKIAQDEEINYQKLIRDVLIDYVSKKAS